MYLPSFFIFRNSLALILLSTLPVIAATNLTFDSKTAHVHEWLGWGEFDSVITVIEPVVRDMRGDSVTMATYWSWLGIAYHGLNQSALGDAAFREAVALKPDLALEPRLVTRDMAQHFAQLADEAKRRQASQVPRDSTRFPASQTQPSRSTALWWWASAGATGALVLGGTITYIIIKSNPKESARENITDIGNP